MIAHVVVGRQCQLLFIDSKNAFVMSALPGSCLLAHYMVCCTEKQLLCKAQLHTFGCWIRCIFGLIPALGSQVDCGCVTKVFYQNRLGRRLQ